MQIWIIGGLSTSSRGWVNDIYCLDVGMHILSPLCFSTSSHYSFTTILYHIKININNTKLSFILLICSAEKNEWTFVIPEGDRPLSPRDKLSSCTIGNKVSTPLPSFHYTLFSFSYSIFLSVFLTL